MVSVVAFTAILPVLDETAGAAQMRPDELEATALTSRNSSKRGKENLVAGKREPRKRCITDRGVGTSTPNREEYRRR
jgi:hypothetical protein